MPGKIRTIVREVTVAEFRELLPGPEALMGALVERPVPRGGLLHRSRILTQEGLYVVLSSPSTWVMIERPPLYENPQARYCAWCREALYTAYAPTDGLTPGWCPSHGKKAPVLHEGSRLAQTGLLEQAGARTAPSERAQKQPIPAAEALPSDLDALVAELKTINIEAIPDDSEQWGDYPTTEALKMQLLSALGVPKHLLDCPTRLRDPLAVFESELLLLYGFKDRADFARLAGIRKKGT